MKFPGNGNSSNQVLVFLTPYFSTSLIHSIHVQLQKQLLRECFNESDNISFTPFLQYTS